MSRHDASAGPSRDVVARIFARLTADRDELRSELELCQRRVAALEQAVRGQEPTASDGEAAPTDASGATALRLAEEALATAQYALEQARRPR